MAAADLMKTARFGALTGACVAALLSVVMTAWDWLENPGGIFRGTDGTRWGFVFETLLSWLVPAFLAAALIAALGHLAVSRIRHAAARRRDP